MTVVPEGVPGALFISADLREMCWFRLQNSDTDELETWFVCPAGHAGPLDPTHDIDENGVVTPSVDCDECAFHDNIQLEGY